MNNLSALLGTNMKATTELGHSPTRSQKSNDTANDNASVGEASLNGREKSIENRLTKDFDLIFATAFSKNIASSRIHTTEAKTSLEGTADLNTEKILSQEHANQTEAVKHFKEPLQNIEAQLSFGAEIGENQPSNQKVDVDSVKETGVFSGFLTPAKIQDKRDATVNTNASDSVSSPSTEVDGIPLPIIQANQMVSPESPQSTIQAAVLKKTLIQNAQIEESALNSDHDNFSELNKLATDLQQNTNRTDSARLQSSIQFTNSAALQERIQEHLQTARKTNLDKIEIKLNPERLGLINITIVQAVDEIKISIKTSSEETARLLSDGLADFQQAYSSNQDSKHGRESRGYGIASEEDSALVQDIPNSIKVELASDNRGIHIVL